MLVWAVSEWFVVYMASCRVCTSSLPHLWGMLVALAVWVLLMAMAIYKKRKTVRYTRRRATAVRETRAK